MKTNTELYGLFVFYCSCPLLVHLLWQWATLNLFLFLSSSLSVLTWRDKVEVYVLVVPVNPELGEGAGLHGNELLAQDPALHHRRDLEFSLNLNQDKDNISSGVSILPPPSPSPQQIA